MNLTFVQNIFFLELSFLETTFVEQKGLNFPISYYHPLYIPPPPILSIYLFYRFTFCFIFYILIDILESCILLYKDSSCN